MLHRVRDRGGGEDDLRGGAVVVEQAEEPSQKEGHVRPEQTAVAVRLIDHNIPEAAEETAPLVVPGEVVVQCVRVGENKAGDLFDPTPLVRWGVPVIDVGEELKACGVFEREKLLLLIVRQCF